MLKPLLIALLLVSCGTSSPLISETSEYAIDSVCIFPHNITSAWAFMQDIDNDGFDCEEGMRECEKENITVKLQKEDDKFVIVIKKH